MELTQLKYFLTVAQTGSITKAAEKLFITQSALSRVIQRLESELGAKLFDREPGRITLNENGKLFQIYVNRSFEALESGIRAVSLIENPGLQVVRVRSELVVDALSPVYDICQTTFPHLSLKFRSYFGDEDGELAADEPTDILVGPELDPGMTLVKSYREKWCAIISRSQAAQFEGGLTLAELAKQPVAFNGPDKDLSFIRSLFEKADLVPNIIVVENMRHAASIINKGLALACVPFNMYYSYGTVPGQDVPFVPLRVTDAVFERDIYLCHRKGFPLTPEEQGILRLLREQLDGFMAAVARFEAGKTG